MSRRGGVKRGAALLLAALLAGAAARAQDGADEAPVRDVRVIVDDEGRPIAELGMLPAIADRTPAGRGNLPFGFELRVLQPRRYRTVEVELEFSRSYAFTPGAFPIGSIAGVTGLVLRGRRRLEAGGVCSFVWLVPLSGFEGLSDMERSGLRLDGVPLAERFSLSAPRATFRFSPEVVAGVLGYSGAEADVALRLLKTSLRKVWPPADKTLSKLPGPRPLPRFSRIWPRSIVHWSTLNLVRFLAYVPPSGRSDPALDRRLLDWVALGGQLLVLGAQPGAQGPLADLLGERAGAHEPVAYGFGQIVTLPRTPSVEQLRRGFEPIGAATEREDWLDRLPAPLVRPLPVPGIGPIPVGGAVAAIAVYALVVAPVALLWFRRRNRPLAYLVFAPLAGLAFSAALVGWIGWREGAGLQRASLSVSLLDQRRHEAVHVASQSLYAGLGGSGQRIVPAAETGVFPVAVHARPFIKRLEIEIEDGQRAIGPSFLRPRIPSQLLVAARRPVRARLQFERTAGGYRWLPDAELVPVAQPGSVVFWNGRGEAFVAGAGGELTPVGAEQARAAALALLGRLEEERARLATEPNPWTGRPARSAGATGGGGVRPYEPARLEPPAWMKRLLAQAAVGPHYVALVERDPAFDDLGLEVRERLSQHVVVGICAAEDVRDGQ